MTWIAKRISTLNFSIVVVFVDAKLLQYLDSYFKLIVINS